MIWVLLIAAAQAHPFASRHFGHRIDLTIEDERLLVGYTAEIPTEALVKEMRLFEQHGRPVTTYEEDKIGELASGLVLTVDGQSVPMARLPSERAEGDTGFFTFVLRFEAPLPPGERHTVELGNANYPEERSFFKNDVRVAEGWAVERSSLLELRDGAVARTYDGRWRQEETFRELTVDIVRRDGWADRLALATSADEDGLLSLEQSFTRTAWSGLSSGWLPLVAGGLGIAGALLALGRRRAASR